MSHDLIAEMDGYRDELASQQRRGNTERADAVRAEIDRVAKAAVTRIEQLLAQAENHEEAGQDLPAAEARVEAKRLARALPPEHRPKHLRALYGEPASGQAPETAVESAPRQTATPRSAGKKGDS